MRFSLAFMTCMLFHSLAFAQSACGAGNSGATYTQVHVGVNNQIIWCADPTFWSQHSADVTPFFAYYDALLPVIGQDFGVTAPGPFYISVDPPNGAASTPTPFGQGVNISGDSFYNVAYNVPGFWGYLLGTHEFVNQWTGILGNGGGWPNDWWADHRSPFPNAMDPILLAQMGQTAAAQAQYNRFIPGGDSADPEVVMFTDLFNAYGKWPFFQQTFALMRTDGVSWSELRDPPNFAAQTPFVSGNPSAMLSNYIVAYFSLAAGADTSSRFSQSIGIGLQPPNWPSDQTYTSYSVDPNQVNLIADAHCALRAAGSPAATLNQFHAGNYTQMVSILAKSAVCGSSCPAECGCNTAQNTCVAKWHATATTTGAPISGTTGGAANGAPASGPQSDLVPNSHAGGCAALSTQTVLLFGALWGVMLGVKKGWR